MYDCLCTVEPQLSGPPFVIRSKNKNGRVPQTRMRIAAVTMETYLIDHVALLFINKVGGSRSGLSITYPAGTKVSG